MAPVSCIYTITSPSGGVYVGSAVDVRARWRSHRHEMQKGVHFNRALQRAFRKYGGELRFEVLLVCRRSDLLFFEQRAIDILRPRYNARPIAHSQTGMKHSDATKAKISSGRRGKGLHTEQWKREASARLIGNKRTLGRPMPSATKAKISAANKGGRHADCLENRLSKADKASLVARYESGEGLVSLASYCGTDHRWMRRLLVSEGAAMRGRRNYEAFAC